MRAKVKVNPHAPCTTLVYTCGTITAVVPTNVTTALDKCHSQRQMSQHCLDKCHSQRQMSQLCLDKCHRQRQMSQLCLDKCHSQRQMAQLNLDKCHSQRQMSQLYPDKCHSQRQNSQHYHDYQRQMSQTPDKCQSSLFHWLVQLPRSSVLGLRPPGLEFRILCLEDSVISIISLIIGLDQPRRFHC